MHRTGIPIAVAMLCLLAGWTVSTAAAEEEGEPVVVRETKSPEDINAERLLKTAEDILLARDFDKAVKMLETIIDRYPKSFVRYKAYMAIGRHYNEIHQYQDAINQFQNVTKLYIPGKQIKGEPLELYLESLYQTGLAYFQLRQHEKAFPVLRKITNNYPNTIWANQAYFYIGMCHFALSNWNKAISALNLVGTFIDPESPTVQYVEAGRRFYVKISDADLPILTRMGKEITVELTTTNGDAETIRCVPLGRDGDVYLGSIATEIGVPVPKDGKLQVLGGDKIMATYLDDNTNSGEKDVPRKSEVIVVSTAAIKFTMGNREDEAASAYMGSNLPILLYDADLDVSANADKVEGIKVVSRYKERSEEDTNNIKGVNVEALFEEEKEDKWIIRDEVTLTLLETGEAAPFHTGKFTAEIPLVKIVDGEPINKTDGVLVTNIDDEIFVTYIDKLHINGDTPREISARVPVIGTLDTDLASTSTYVAEADLRARKALVEAQAFLELGRIFKGMGLSQGAYDKCNSALDLISSVIRADATLAQGIRELGYKLKWECEIVKDDFPAAIATCQIFSQMFPDSPLVDQALMGMGKAKLEDKNYSEAIAIFNKVLQLETSYSKPEAMFYIARATEEGGAGAANQGAANPAIPLYRSVVEKFPDSEFAGHALAKVIDYYIRTRDFVQADDLLEQVFRDYPDAQFLDSMLLKWVIVSFQRADYRKSLEKCQTLLFEYPSSPFAEQAKQILPRIEGRLKP